MAGLADTAGQRSPRYAPAAAPPRPKLPFLPPSDAAAAAAAAAAAPWLRADAGRAFAPAPASAAPALAPPRAPGPPPAPASGAPSAFASAALAGDGGVGAFASAPGSPIQLPPDFGPPDRMPSVSGPLAAFPDLASALDIFGSAGASGDSFGAWSAPAGGRPSPSLDVLLGVPEGHAQDAGQAAMPGSGAGGEAPRGHA